MPRLIINGQTREADVDPDTPLLWVLRDTLGLTGTSCPRSKVFFSKFLISTGRIA